MESYFPGLKDIYCDRDFHKSNLYNYSSWIFSLLDEEILLHRFNVLVYDIILRDPFDHQFVISINSDKIITPFNITIVKQHDGLTLIYDGAIFSSYFDSYNETIEFILKTNLYHTIISYLNINLIDCRYFQGRIPRTLPKYKITNYKLKSLLVYISQLYTNIYINENKEIFYIGIDSKYRYYELTTECISYVVPDEVKIISTDEIYIVSHPADRCASILFYDFQIKLTYPVYEITR